MFDLYGFESWKPEPQMLPPAPAAPVIGFGDLRALEAAMPVTDLSIAPEWVTWSPPTAPMTGFGELREAEAADPYIAPPVPVVGFGELREAEAADPYVAPTVAPIVAFANALATEAVAMGTALTQMLIGAPVGQAPAPEPVARATRPPSMGGAIIPAPVVPTTGGLLGTVQKAATAVIGVATGNLPITTPIVPAWPVLPVAQQPATPSTPTTGQNLSRFAAGLGSWGWLIPVAILAGIGSRYVPAPRRR